MIIIIAIVDKLSPFQHIINIWSEKIDYQQMANIINHPGHPANTHPVYFSSFSCSETTQIFTLQALFALADELSELMDGNWLSANFCKSKMEQKKICFLSTVKKRAESYFLITLDLEAKFELFWEHSRTLQYIIWSLGINSKSYYRGKIQAIETELWNIL